MNERHEKTRDLRFPDAHEKAKLASIAHMNDHTVIDEDGRLVTSGVNVLRGARECLLGEPLAGCCCTIIAEELDEGDLAIVTLDEGVMIGGLADVIVFDTEGQEIVLLCETEGESWYVRSASEGVAFELPETEPEGPEE